MNNPDLHPGNLIEQLWQAILEEKKQVMAEHPEVSGARFLYSGESTLLDNDGLMLAGINPGIESNMADRAFQASGVNAYVDYTEQWGSAYRANTRAALDRVLDSLQVENPGVAWNRMLTANYCPFRTKEGSRFLKASPRAKRFSTQLWARIIPMAKIRVVICCGQSAYEGFADVRSHMETAALDLVPWPHASRPTIQITEQNINQTIKAIKAAHIQL